MRACKRCGEDVGDRALSCPLCGASLSLDAFLSVAIMKLTGIVCGTLGVALLVFADQIVKTSDKTGSPPYVPWIGAGVLMLVGFVMFWRRWAEQDEP